MNKEKIITQKEYLFRLKNHKLIVRETNPDYHNLLNSIKNRKSNIFNKI